MNLSDQDISRIADAIADRLMIGARWMRLKQACAEYCLGQKRLRALVADGTVTGYPDNDRGDLVIERASLEAWRRGRAGDIADRALDLLKRCG